MHSIKRINQLLQFFLVGALLLGVLGVNNPSPATQDDDASGGQIHQFDRQPLTTVYFSEGVAVGDLNNDGIPDVVYGPYWFEGPDFRRRHEIYAPQPQPMQGYANHFFAWIEDFDGDGWNDILVVGFPATPAYVYQNPGADNVPDAEGHSTSPLHWKKHQVFDWVSNESPAFVDLTGDGRRELLCTRQGYFGYVQPPPSEMGKFEPWTFQRISNAVAPDRFGHGLGTGDIDGDGRLDVLTKDGWFAQPAELKGELWKFHPFQFADAGGAEMYAYDVNGNGLNDVITSLDAHGYGLAWWEQERNSDGQISFKQHLITGSRPSENPYGIVVSEPHSVAIADIDGDGLIDIVTGKTYWSHHRNSPAWDAGPMVYWFQLKRTESGVEWIPHRVDDTSGIGRQIVTADVNNNGLLDIVTGGMLGCHVMHHSSRWAEGIEYEAATPKPRQPLADGLTAIEAAKQMTVPQGFHVQLAASEPDVHQPVALAIDHRGRVWIAEAYNYPQRAPEGEGSDRIVILEDTNQDGRLDHRKVFIEGLNLVSGLEVGFGGVYVGAAPYLMFIPDADGDDIPDGPPQILLDGFGYQDTHETLNSFNWGPDGWLYGCHGVFTHSLVGKPGTPANQRTPLNAGFWRYHPIQHQFEIFAWGTSNPWGIDFNDYGQAFATVCVIPHLFHVIPGARYHRQAGQHFDRYHFDDIKTIADHLHYSGNIADHAWWGHEPDIQSDTSDAGGGHAHCGAMVYLGDNWPQRYRNSIFMNNIHGNRVNMDRLVRRGSGYMGRHGDDFLMANDRWFRGINLRYGPDGTVYLIDWYDQNACHRVNPEIWDRSNGRVYNISYGVADRKAVDLESMDDAELAALAMHRNDWFVRVSRRILQHRAARGVLNQQAVSSQIATLLQHDDDTRVLRGIWLGHATGLLTDQQLEQLLHHPSAYVVYWSIQLACHDGTPQQNTVDELARMATKTGQDPLIRLALASVAQRIDFDQRWPIVEALVQHTNDGGDHNLPLMIWYATEPLVTVDPDRALRLFGEAKIDLIRNYLIRRAAVDPKALDSLITQLPRVSRENQQLILQQCLLAFEGSVNVAMPGSWEAAYQAIQNGESIELVKVSELNELADRLAVVFGDRRVFPKLRSTLADADKPIEQRQRALSILVEGRDREAVEALHQALATPELQSPAIRALAAWGNAETPQVLLQSYARFQLKAKEDAIATLAARADSAKQLLDAIEQGSIPRSDIHAFHVRQMSNLNDPHLMRRLESSWGKIAESTAEQQAAIETYKQHLPPSVLSSANLGHGRALYEKNCASCHKLFGEGELIGPDLTGSDRANLDYILENLVAPNAVVGRDYQMNVFLLEDGRVVSGLITRETESALTIKTINDSVVIAKNEIEEQRLSELSLMPSGLIDPLSNDELRDLVGYLASPVQVALRGPAAVIDPETRMVADGYEGESMVVLENSAGNVSRQDMKGFRDDRWSGDDHLWWKGANPGDRLVLEIEVPENGEYELQAVFTMARDYGVVQLYWNDEKIGAPIDLFNSPQVITSGVISFGQRSIAAGKHRLGIEVVGANQQAVQAFMFGLDFFRLQRLD